MLSAEQIIQTLNLKPHPQEGGYFRETYRSSDVIPVQDLGGKYQGRRSLSTAIYYLLTPKTFSEIHRLKTDEIFHFYLGDPVTMLQLSPDGSSRTFTLGPYISEGQNLQLLVPKGTWQGAFLNEGGAYALLGTTVAPGFDFDDYESGREDELVKKYPDQKDLINRLTK